MQFCDKRLMPLVPRQSFDDVMAELLRRIGNLTRRPSVSMPHDDVGTKKCNVENPEIVRQHPYVAGKGAAILVVEDEILVRIAAADFLIAAGYSVLAAADAAEAISVLEAGHEIDLVFTEIRMPGLLGGICLMRYVREHFPSVAVILNSASRPGHDVLGDTVFIEKPYLPGAVLLAIESEIGRRGRNRAAGAPSC